MSDTSRPGQENPSPNTGLQSAIQSGMFVIPRRANNLFFNVAGPADCVTPGAAEADVTCVAVWAALLPSVGEGAGGHQGTNRPPDSSTDGARSGRACSCAGTAPSTST